MQSIPIPASATFLVAVLLVEEKLRATGGTPVIAGVHRAAVPVGWIKLTSGTLSLQAPVGTIVEPEPGVDSSGWSIHGPQFYLRASLGSPSSVMDPDRPPNLFCIIETDGNFAGN